MKRIVSILLVTFIVFSFASCLDTSTDTKKIEGEVTISNSTQDVGEQTKTENDNSKKDLSITEQVCFEYDGVKVTAKSIVDEPITGKGIKLLVENNSVKNYTVTVDELIVNNYMTTPLFSCEVSAGKKSNDTLHLYSTDLEKSGIENVGQIEIYFRVYDSESYETKYKAPVVTIKTSQFDKMDTKADDSGHELYNKDGIKIIGKYVDENTFWGKSILLYVENKTDKNITVSCDDFSINGFMITSLFSSTVYSQKYAIDDITIFDSSLDENNITSIDTVELKFKIFDSETFKTIVETEPITFSAK